MLIEKMRYKTNNKFNIFIKKVVAMSVIVTNLSFAIPIASFAEDSKSDTDQKYPALVPVAADSIISKSLEHSHSPLMQLGCLMQFSLIPRATLKTTVSPACLAS